MKKIVILSGGMDSTVALAYTLSISKLGDEVIALTFDYGSKHNNQEINAAKTITGFYQVKHKIVSLPFINDLFVSDLLRSGGEIPDGHYQDESMKKTVVPFRNGIMLAIAAGYAESIGADEIVLGNHTGDHAIYPDCRQEFSQAMGEAIKYGTYPGIKVSNPFNSIDKTQICGLGVNLHVPLDLTYSCYKGGEIHCGKCGTCTERKEAFRETGSIDPTVYEE